MAIVSEPCVYDVTALAAGNTVNVTAVLSERAGGQSLDLSTSPLRCVSVVLSICERESGCRVAPRPRV